MHIKYQQLSPAGDTKDKTNTPKILLASTRIPHEYQFITFIVLVMSYYTIILIMLPVQ